MLVTPDPLGLVLVALAAVAAGAINAIAGGGTLVSFPVMTAVGIPAIAANVTNTVALWPGMVGGIYAQRRDLAGQAGRLWAAIPVAAVGGVAGGVLLMLTGESTFRAMVPYLILLATGLLALQDRLRAWLLQHPTHTHRPESALRIGLPVGAAAVYGGYFGAGLGVILLAVLGLIVEDTLTRLNALKQAIALAANFAAAVYFLFTGQVIWTVVLVMAVGALAGGALGGRVASRIAPRRLRAVVIVLGFSAALIYLVR
jgi:uncharacterized membrane protein YfcA